MDAGWFGLGAELLRLQLLHRLSHKYCGLGWIRAGRYLEGRRHRPSSAETLRNLRLGSTNEPDGSSLLLLLSQHHPVGFCLGGVSGKQCLGLLPSSKRVSVTGVWRWQLLVLLTARSEQRSAPAASRIKSFAERRRKDGV